MVRSTFRCHIALSGDDLANIRQALAVLPARSTHLAASNEMQEGLLAAGHLLFPGIRWYLFSDEHGPAAIVPLQRIEERDSRLRPVALYSLSRFELLYGDARVRHDIDAGVLMPALLKATKPGERCADVVRLRDLPDDSALRAIAESHTATGDMTAKPGTSLLLGAAGAAEWEASLSKNLRGQVRQAAKRLAALGPVDVRTATSPAEVQAAFRRFLELEVSGYKGALNALAKEEGDRRVLEQALYSHAELSHSIVMEVWVGERLAASQFGIRCGERLFLIKVAYNEAMSDASPGVFLMAELMRWVSDHPELAVVDCCVRQKWHDRWHPTLEARSAATIPNAGSWRGAVIRATRWLRSRGGR